MHPQSILLFLIATATATPLLPRVSNSTSNSTSTAGEFGTCSPAMDFQLGRPGRKATEGTFLPTDPTVASGQGDALNPNIITNAICNNLINDCGLTKDSPGETKCLAAKAQISALGTKDASTAAAWNAALGV
jgi:hypothetical protein